VSRAARSRGLRLPWICPCPRASAPDRPTSRLRWRG
jgi:hypothetical protein